MHAPLPSKGPRVTGCPDPCTPKCCMKQPLSSLFINTRLTIVCFLIWIKYIYIYCDRDIDLKHFPKGKVGIPNTHIEPLSASYIKLRAFSYLIKWFHFPGYIMDTCTNWFTNTEIHTHTLSQNKVLTCRTFSGCPNKTGPVQISKII